MTITVEQVIATLEEVVAEKGEDYVYPDSERNAVGDCVYSTKDGKPSCIVGYVVERLDPKKFKEFAEAETEIEGFGIGQAFGAFSDIPQLDNWDKRMETILYKAQAAQDNGKTWGEALTAAKAAL